MRDTKKDADAVAEEAAVSTAAILSRSEQAANRIEEMLKESEALLARLRSGQ